MNFRKATDLMLDAGVSVEEIAAALELKPQTVRAMRLSEDSPSHRKAPTDWRLKLARLAMDKEKELDELSRRLKREAGE